MAILDVVYYGDPRLELISEPVTEVTPEVRKLVRDMFETMYYTGGVGLSAPQIGVNRRLLVIDVSGGNDRSKQITLINPTIVEQSGEQKGSEGCLSFPGLFADVTRANYVRARGVDLNGKEIELEGSELLARAILHEIDHLDGILFIQRMKKSDRESIIKKMKKQQFQNKEVKEKVLI
jgi:peptide deformylase